MPMRNQRLRMGIVSLWLFQDPIELDVCLCLRVEFLLGRNIAIGKDGKGVLSKGNAD